MASYSTAQIKRRNDALSHIHHFLPWLLCAIGNGTASLLLEQYLIDQRRANNLRDTTTSQSSGGGASWGGGGVYKVSDEFVCLSVGVGLPPESCS